MDGAEGCHHSGAVAKADYQILFSMFSPQGLDDFARDGFLSFWHELIRRYSTTNLSRKSDLLTALAGLAKQVQRKSRLTWSFGLWRECLLRDLLWFVRGGIGTTCHDRAPTWSWASIDVQKQQVMYEPATEVSLLAEIINLPHATDFARRPGSSVDETKHCVKIIGLLRPGCPDFSKYGQNTTSSAGSDIRVHRNCKGMQHIHTQCPFHPDYELPDSIELHSLLVAYASGTQQTRGSRQSWETHVGIVLTPVSGRQNRYKRVGYFHMDIQDQIEGEDQQLSWLLENSKTVEVEII